jgi:ketosteroid isomerase-like protein
MSKESVDLVRRAYETWNQQGPAAIGEMLADDVEVHDAPDLPDAGAWRGREAVIERLGAVAEAVGGGSVEFERITDCGPRVLVAMHWQLERQTGDVDLGEVFHLVTVEGGAITRIQVFLTEAEALSA